MTPLHVAAENARIKVMEYLIDQGTNINAKDNNEVNFIYHCWVHTRRYVLLAIDLSSRFVQTHELWLSHICDMCGHALSAAVTTK